jgi:flavodoxin
MKAALYFSSPHGRTKKVVQEAVRQLQFPIDVFDLQSPPSPEIVQGYELNMFFTPNYGDEELPEDMESFLLSLPSDLSGTQFIVCELGNYGGYDDFSFGVLHVLRRRLFDSHSQECCPPLSLDAMPRTNWKQLERWTSHVNRSLNALSRL